MKMNLKELTEEAVTSELTNWKKVGELAYSLRQEGYKIGKELDGLKDLLNGLEEKGKLYSFPRGMNNTPSYILIDRLSQEDIDVRERWKDKYSWRSAA